MKRHLHTERKKLIKIKKGILKRWKGKDEVRVRFNYLTRASSKEAAICLRACASSQNILWLRAWLEMDRLSRLATRDSVP